MTSTQPSKNFSSAPLPPSPESSREEFHRVVEEECKQFGESLLARRLESGDIRMEHYHQIMISIFHQSRHSPLTFAIAGASLPNHQWEMQSYLLQHAEEEKTHWQWALQDLEKTGYRGPRPESLFPNPSTLGYISFNFFAAYRMPIVRLGTAAMLESLGAKAGVKYGKLLCKHLNLSPEQAIFIMAHGETDVGHIAEIFDLFDRANLSAQDWGALKLGAQTGGHLYRRMLSEAVSNRVSG